MSEVKENINVSGGVVIVLKDKHGNVKTTREVDNLIVNKGLAFIASRMAGTSKATMSHMSLGSGTTTPSATQTDLTTRLGSRETLDSTVISGTNSEKVVYTCGFEAGDATGAVTEAAIHNAASGGDMLCRVNFDVVNKAADDVMTITWTITIAAS